MGLCRVPLDDCRWSRRKPHRLSVLRNDLSQSTPFDVAELVTWGEGYAPMLYGKVVDMFYFPLIETTLPQWIPIWGGDDYIFFSPVFNFADSSISVGIVTLVIFFRRELEGANNTFWRGTRWEKKEQE